MCGFSGWILNKEINTDIIVSSLRAIKHRGPDDTLIVTGENSAEFYSSELSNAYSKATYPLINKHLSETCFGFNRLSIVDLSDHAMQPFFDEAQNVLFMLNGEIYNYAELKSEFLNDVQFTSDSDSEVAFHLYKKLGNTFVEKLKGMFAIVVYNYNTRSLYVWRDRLGIKPFFYTQTEHGLMFSSEMKGLFAMQIKKELNYKGLAYSMYLGTCPSPLTIYQDIYSLQPGHFLTFSGNTQKTDIQSYWHLKYTENKEPIDPGSFYSDIENICQLYATGEVEKSIMLSGGIDSGTLAYFYGKCSKNIEAVHIYSDIPDNEYEFAQINAQNAGIYINNYLVSQTINAVEKDFFLKSEEEPNASPEPALVLCDKIRAKKIKVLYNALGPDEIFGGYGYFQQTKRFSRIPALSHIPLFLIPSKQRYKIREMQEYGVDSYPFIARQLFSWDETKQFLTKNNQAIPEHPILYIKNQIHKLYPEFSNLPLLKKVSYYDIFYYIASHHTFRCDQPSMLYSIEMRFPFLEHTFIEKYFNQADTFENIEKKLKPQFREYVEQILSPKVLNNKKHGFSIPVEKMVPESKHLKANKQWYLLMLNKIKSE